MPDLGAWRVVLDLLPVKQSGWSFTYGVSVSSSGARLGLALRATLIVPAPALSRFLSCALLIR